MLEKNVKMFEHKGGESFIRRSVTRPLGVLDAYESPDREIEYDGTVERALVPVPSAREEHLPLDRCQGRMAVGARRYCRGADRLDRDDDIFAAPASVDGPVNFELFRSSEIIAA